MAAVVDCQEAISSVFDTNNAALAQISKELWSNPEQSYQEVCAHAIITQFLSDRGFEVEEKFVAETGFRAVFSSENGSAGDAGKPLNVCFICQYDAVGELGHASGHNLQTVGSLGAALAIKTCLQKGLLKGQVTILGTPGEDCGHGAKIDMLRKDVFSDIDCCLMLTPFNYNVLYPKFFNLLVVDVTYKGKAAHSSAFPWEGRNALDAAVACYNNVALLRQQLKPNWSINGVITEGGSQPNVIPKQAQLKFWLRAPDDTDLFFIQQKCQACFVAAGKATGCEANFEFEDKPNLNVNHNSTLGEIYKHHAQDAGSFFPDDPDVLNSHLGSTDMGNVSKQVPTIMPAYNIGTQAALNSEAFHEACGTDEAFATTLAAAKVLAFTVGEVMGDRTRSSNMRTEHKEMEEQSNFVQIYRRSACLSQERT